MLELRHLRYFIAVAAERNFTRAAEILNIAQPPLSRQIKLIEEELGVTLIERDKRPLELTPAWRLFYEQSLQVVQRMKQLRETMAAYKSSRRPILPIGFVPSVIYGRLPDIVRAYRADFKEVDLELTEMTTLQQVAALKEGRVDIGFGRIMLDDDEAIEQIVLRRDPLVLAVPADHELARRKRRIPLSAIAGEALIIYPRAPRPSYADQVLSILRDKAIEPRRIREVMEMQTAVGLVAAGSGLCLVPSSVRQLKRPNVAYCDLADDVATPITMNIRIDDRTRGVLSMARVIKKIYLESKWPIPKALDDLASRPMPSR